MLTAKIYLAESGQVADLQKDFPIYQGQFQNILLNVFVPTSLLAANFTEKTEDYGDLTTPFVAGTAVKIAMRTVARNGAFKMSNDHYLRYVKTLIKDGVQYALYERKMPREFTFYAGQGINAPTLIINAVNVTYGEITAATASSENTNLTCSTDLNTIKQRFLPVTQKYDYTYSISDYAWYLYGTRIGTTDDMYTEYGIKINGIVFDQDVVTLSITASEPAVTNITASQTIRLDVMPSSDLDNDTAIEADEWDLVEATITSLTASINALVDAMPLKQDRSDAGLKTNNKTVVGAINEVNTNTNKNTGDVSDLQERVTTLENTMSTGETYIGTLTTTTLPTDAQLNSFVEQHTDPSRSPKTGDTVIVVLQIPDATDKNYKYFFSGATQSWSGYEIPPIERAANGTAGIIDGTYTAENIKGLSEPLLVDIRNGEIKSIWILMNDPILHDKFYADVQNVTDVMFDDIYSIQTGATVVGAAQRAFADEDGNNIKNTYQTQKSGATKQYVKDYALPKEFNNILYLAKGGYQPTVPTEPANGIQADAGSTVIGETKLFSIPYTLADVEFMLGAKNSYSNDFYIGVESYPSGGVTVQFRLVTSIKKGTNDPVEAAVELTDEITFDSLTPQKISMAAPMTLLGKNVYELEKDDQIIQELSVIRTTSDPILFFVFGNSTYPSNLHLYTGSVVVLEAAEVVQEEGTSPKQVMSQKAVTDALATKLDIPYTLQFPVGESAVTYDTTNGISHSGTMQMYTSADKTEFVDLPGVLIRTPIAPADDTISMDAEESAERVLIKAQKGLKAVSKTADGGYDFTLSDGTHLYAASSGLTPPSDTTKAQTVFWNPSTNAWEPTYKSANAYIIMRVGDLSTYQSNLVLHRTNGTAHINRSNVNPTDPTTPSKNLASLEVDKSGYSVGIGVDGTTSNAYLFTKYQTGTSGGNYYRFPIPMYDGQTAVPITEYNVLTDKNVKTLFGNKSIYGSGNIDLYRHDIELSVNGLLYSSISYGGTVRVTLYSSSNTPIDSLTDFYNAYNNGTRKIPVSGTLTQQGGGTHLIITALYPTAMSTGLQGHYVTNSGAITSFDIAFGWSGSWTVTDDVTTI